MELVKSCVGRYHLKIRCQKTGNLGKTRYIFGWLNDLSSLHLGKSNKRYLLPAQVDLWLVQTIQWVGSIMQVVPTF
jgi:hypothetical protein